MAWLGSSGGCAVYYFITSWLVGLSNYLVVCLVCMILVKRAASVLARLHECKYLLLSLVVITVLPAIPELFIRSKSFISNQRQTFHQVHCGLLWSGRLHSLHKGRHVRLVHPLQTAPTPPPPRCPCPPLPLQTKDFCRQENLFDLPWRARSLRVWSLRSRTDQTS